MSSLSSIYRPLLGGGRSTQAPLLPQLYCFVWKIIVLCVDYVRLIVRMFMGTARMKNVSLAINCRSQWHGGKGGRRSSTSFPALITFLFSTCVFQVLDAGIAANYGSLHLALHWRQLCYCLRNYFFLTWLRAGESSWLMNGRVAPALFSG